MHQPGYITSETLINTEDSRQVLVLGTWVSAEHWKAWETAEQRIALTDLMEQFLAGETKVRICDFAGTEEE